MDVLQRWLDDPQAALASSNVAAAFLRQAIDRPKVHAVATPRGGFWSSPRTRPYEFITFGDLIESTLRTAHGLHQNGVGPGTRVALMVPPSVELIQLVYALFQFGAVPVLIDPGMGLKNIGQCLAEAEPTAFIGIAKAHIARSLAGWGRSSIRQLVTVGRSAGWWGGVTLSTLQTASTSGTAPFFAATGDDPAAILFTSGSTGVPKGAVYTHGIFNEQIHQLRTLFHIEPGDVDLCTFPLFALFAPVLGMMAVIPKMDATRPAKVRPAEIIDVANRLCVTNLFGSPALLNRVGRSVLAPRESRGGTGVRLSSLRSPGDSPGAKTLRRVLSAGAPVSPAILERFQELLSPGVQIFTPYGATEALPVAVIGSDDVLRDTRHQTARGAGTCVGRPVAGLEVRIIRISDEPIAAWSEDLVLPPGEIGEIAVYGPQVTQEYFRRPDLTALAKIPDATRGRKWHRMGDVGYFDDQGRLWFCGRKSQRVITPQRTYFTDPVEGVFNTVPGVFRTALVGVKKNGVMTPVLCVELERGAKPQAVVRSELLSRGVEFELTRDVRVILFHPRFPVDIRHNSKIFREKLAVWAAMKSF